MKSELFGQLINQFEGELRSDDLSKAIYSTDASVYQMTPKGVAIPRNEDDLVKLVSWSANNKVPLIPRAAGTSLAGQCVGDGVVVDTSKYLNRIIAFDKEKRLITVEPGVIRDELNQFLQPHGLFFGPNTSTANRCMIGGMVGNNSSGTTSIRYGVTRDKVVGLRCILSDGSIHEFGELLKESNIPSDKITSKFGQQIENQIIGLLTENGVKEEIEKEFPKKERIGRMVQMHSNNREEIKEVRAGDIAACIGLKDITTGDTLSDIDKPIVLERMDFPEPVISVAVEPKSKPDQEKMSLALGKLAQEDPSFRVASDEESGQTIISGMGELHLDVLVDRMRREFSVEANIGKPQVAYRETIKESVEVEGKFVRQSGGKGQYGHVWLKLEPLGLDDEYEFVDKIVGGVIPKEYIPAVNKGIQEQMQNGVIAGYPLLALRATLYDGSFHDVDSNEMAFKIAGSMALKEGATKAKPAILEPIMKVVVVTPEEHMGDVVGDLNRRRGIILGMEDITSGKEVSSEVPLAEMFGYATDLRSATQGRATFTMEFTKYGEVPSNIAETLKTS
jgi:hypothetical protein